MVYPSSCRNGVTRRVLGPACSGLTNPWDVARMMRERLGCSTTYRELSYWAPVDSRVLQRLLELTRSGSPARGEMVVLLCISDTLFVRAVMKGWKEVDDALVPGQPEHWVACAQSKK